MVPLAATRVESRRFVFPGETNAAGTVHGGTLLGWMESVGAMSAMRFAGTDAVTVRVRGDEEDPHTADRTLAAAATVTLVATDDGGDPVSVPTLTVESEIGQRLADRAARDGA